MSKFTRDKFIKRWDEASRAAFAQPALIAELAIDLGDHEIAAENAINWLLQTGRAKKTSERALKSTFKVYGAVADKMPQIIEKAIESGLNTAQFRTTCRLVRDGKPIQAAIKAATKKKPKAPLDADKVVERLNRLWNEAVEALGEKKALAVFEAWFNS